MKTKGGLTDRQIEVRECYYKNNCNEQKTAIELGINVTSLRKTLYFCARKGYRVDPDDFCPEAPAGWGMFMSTIQSNSEGIVQRWDRVRPFEQNQEQLFEYLKTRIPSEHEIIKPPHICDKEIQLEWILADVHFGLMAWGEETGEDYDIKIARDLIINTAIQIFNSCGYVDETALVLLGDNFHSDFFRAVTEKSNHSLDVDTRYPKMLLSGVETFISAIEIALKYSKKVKVIVLYGNHDKQTSTALPIILYAWFRNEDRVEIDLSPSIQHYNYWGCSATMYHHGDNTNKNRLCGNFTRYVAMQSIPGIKYFYVKQGHLHKEIKEDINGVIYEVVASPVASDSFANSHVYTSKRATVATKYHKKYGELCRYTFTPQSIELMAKGAGI